MDRKPFITPLIDNKYSDFKENEELLVGNVPEKLSKIDFRNIHKNQQIYKIL